MINEVRRPEEIGECLILAVWFCRGSNEEDEEEDEDEEDFDPENEDGERGGRKARRQSGPRAR